MLVTPRSEFGEDPDPAATHAANTLILLGYSLRRMDESESRYEHMQPLQPESE